MGTRKTSSPPPGSRKSATPLSFRIGAGPPVLLRTKARPSVVRRTRARSSVPLRTRARPSLPLRTRARPSAPLRIGLGFLALLVPSLLHAQLGPECPEGRIAEISIDGRAVFDLAEMDGGGRLRWAYRLANAVHMETRPNFVRRELLFRVGDCYDPVLLADSERILRRFAFIASARVTSETLPDGSKKIHVRTRDEWTTRVNLGLVFDNGLDFESLHASETNLFGRGASIGLFYDARRMQDDLGVTLATPQLFGTRWDAAASVGETRQGGLLAQRFSYPFVGEVGRTAIRQVYGRRESHFSYLEPRPAGSRHVILPFFEEVFAVGLARRFGRPGRLTIFGLGLSRERISFDDFPGKVEIEGGEEANDASAADPDLIERLAPQTVDLSMLRLSLLLGRRNLQFVRRARLDAIRAIQDVGVGTAMSATVGANLGRVGAESPDHVATRLRFYWGAAPGNWIVTAQLHAEGRLALSGDADAPEWTDLLAEADGYLYWQPGGSSGHTLFGRISAAGGWRVQRPFQLTLGGRNSVRGYRENDFPGGRTVVVSVEDRYALPWPRSNVLDLGFTLFADAGRMWAGGVPFGADSKWRASVGGGLRLGFPAGTRTVVRFDVSFPTTPTPESGRFSFRITTGELLGLLAGFGDPEIARSRRFDVGAGMLSGR